MLNTKQKALIDDVARANQFDNYNISVQPGSKKGDNYLGTIYLINIQENGSVKKKSLILKCAETNTEVRKQFPIHETYSREIFVYQTLLPAFDSFQRRHNIKYPFKSFTTLYGSSNEEGGEFLLMENINIAGFRMLQRKSTMDDAHVTCVLKEMAKFHSLSLAMSHLEPELYENLTSNLEDQFEKHTEFLDLFISSTEQKLPVAQKIVEDHRAATEALREYRNNLKDLFKEFGDKKNGLVVIHGDMWCNNMMFKYDDIDPHIPSKMCFLDWQICKQQSPITDLLYFMLLSAPKSILDNFQMYLKIYHAVLDENLKSIGCDTKTVFPYELLEELWRKHAKAMFAVSLGSLLVVLRDEEEVETFADIAKEGRSIVGDLFKHESISEEYRQRIRDIILSLLQNNCL